MLLSIVVAEQYFGASTTFVRSAGMLERFLFPEHVQQVEYFIKEKPKIDWQWMFVAGIFIGSLLSSVVSKQFRVQSVPLMWQKRFGPGRLKRFTAAFFGGIAVMFGARLAGG